MIDIKPIETRYAGCRFRSRLEARWAVWFDQLGIRWEYEPQGYELPSGARYLPDFWLPGLRLHAEVKGSEQSFLNDGPRYAEAIQARSLPGDGLLILGPVPTAEDGTPQHFVLIAEDHPTEGTVVCLHILLGDWMVQERADGDNLMSACTDMFSKAPELPNVAAYGRSGATFTQAIPMRDGVPVAAELVAAYRAARSARFEHGESGIPLPTPAGPTDAELDAAVTQAAADHDITTADGRVAALRSVRHILAEIPEQHRREQWIVIAADALKLGNALDAVSRAVDHVRATNTSKM